jgi:cellobiose phosphorylase
MMQYGYFDEPNREYVITNPHTPVKWINYVGTLAFGGFVDHTGGALLCKGDPSLNRLTRYIPQLPASDFKGTTLYVRVHANSGYRLFSAFYVPCLAPFDVYECRVGLGYSRFRMAAAGVEVDTTVFVPRGAECEIRDIQVTNRSQIPLTIDLIPVVEYSHFDALKQFTNADWVPQTMQSRVVDSASGIKILTQYAFMKKDTAVNYLTSNQPAASFESDRRRFLGENEYGTWANPLSLQADELSNYEAQRGDNIGALLHHLESLAPGESRRLIVQFGQAETIADAQPAIEHYRQPENIDAALQEQRDFWDEYLSRLQVDTPSKSLNRMINVHNAYQCYITKNWSRYLSLYQVGLGERGIGFRDSSQDVLGILVGAPEEGKALIRMLLHTQKRSGDAMHQFNPLSMVAVEGDAREGGDAPRYYSDDHLWIILAVCEYLKETGDLAFLDERIPFYEKAADGTPLETGTVLDHLQRALAFTHQDTGAHGLPLLGFADWNDTVNLRAGAESLFTANLYGKALVEMAKLCQALNDQASESLYCAWYDEMQERVNQHAWDGDWYIRYFDWDGAPLGSRTNTHGQIYTNGQSWAVISGFAPPERAESAMQAVFERLNTRSGIKLSAPGFDGYDPTKGGVTTYPPGAKENGGIFLHSNPWAIIAETILGNGDRAYQYYEQINPAAKNDHLDEFECEPYVYPQNILGDEHPQFGLARNSWLSGTAAWAYTAATRNILGLHPTFTGLQIDPCLPQSWDQLRAVRWFRGAWYDILIRNPHHSSRGVVSLVVDGKQMEGTTAPIFDDGKYHTVIVELGAR